MSVIENACSWAVNIANDNSHGYDQINRWGNPDFDCSSLVISSFENAGLKVREAGATYTGNMKNAFAKCGFEVIPYKKLMELRRGDVVLCDHYTNGKYYGHTLLYLGDNKIVQASINEKGTIKGGTPGDQTKKEIAVGGFYQYSKGWDVVLRYHEGTEGEKTVNVIMPELHEGMNRPEVGMVQTLLKSLGFKGKAKTLKVDNDFGPNTAYAVANFQKSVGLTPDSVVGAKTYPKLFSSKY